MADKPITLEEYQASRDWVELGPNEVPGRGDICIIPNDYYRQLPLYLQGHWGSYKTVAQRRATHGCLTEDLHYFRCTLGTIANPHRPEHFVNGKVPTNASILADYEQRHFVKNA